MRMALPRVGTWCALALGATLIMAGCAPAKPSPKQVIAEFESAFGLKSGTAAPTAGSPADLAAQAAQAMRSNDWPKAAAILELLRNTPGVSGDQGMAINRAAGVAYARASEAASKGDAGASETLKLIDKQRERH